MKGKEFFQTLGTTLGMSAEQISKITGNDSLNTIDVSEEIATMFKNVKVFTEESAKANPEIRAAIRAEDLNGMDAMRSQLLEKYELPDDVKNAIKAEKKTSAWMSTLLEKVALKEAEKATTSGKAKTELEKEIEKLNSQILQVKGEYEGKLKDLETGRYNDRVNWELKSVYGNFDYAMGEVEKPIAINAAMSVVESKLREKGVIFKLTENGLAPFVNKDGSETAYFDNNQKISAIDLIKKTLLENKLLKVNGETDKGKPQFQQNRGQQNQPEKKIAGSEGLKEDLKAALVRDGFGG